MIVNVSSLYLNNTVDLQGQLDISVIDLRGEVSRVKTEDPLRCWWNVTFSYIVIITGSLSSHFKCVVNEWSYYFIGHLKQPLSRFRVLFKHRVNYKSM